MRRSAKIDDPPYVKSPLTGSSVGSERRLPTYSGGTSCNNADRITRPALDSYGTVTYARPPAVAGELSRELLQSAQVGPEGLRHGHRTVGILIVLEHGHERSPDSEPGAVQRMYGLGPAAVGIAPAGLHAPRLEGLEVAAGGDLPIAALRRQPDLEIIGLGAAEADVGAAEGDRPVRQLQALEHFLGMARQLLEHRVGIRRTHDLHQLHLVELVAADHAARVLAGRARLGPEARRVADILQRQGLGRHDLLAHQIGDGHFRSRDQIERLLTGLCARSSGLRGLRLRVRRRTHLTLAAHLEEVILELRQLPGAEQRLP